MKVLLADGEGNVRDLFADQIDKTDYDFEVNDVKTGEKFLEELDKDVYDVMISDQKIDDMGGLELLEMVRDEGFDIPFIILIEEGEDEAAMEALKLGAEKYVKKIGSPQDRFEYIAQAIIQLSDHSHRKDEGRLQRAYFEQLFEKSPEGIVLLDNEDSILEANERFEEMFGYMKEEMKGEPINDLIVPEENISEASSLSEDVLTGENIEEESIRVRKDGKEFPVSIMGYPIRLDEEQVGVIGIYRDLSEKKEREKKLRELYEASIKIAECSSEREVYEQVLLSAKNILDFRASSIALVEDDEFVVKATMTKNLEVGDRLSMEGLRCITYEKKEPYLIDGIQKWGEKVSDPEYIPKPTDPDFTSAISLPIKDEGVFQAMAYEEGYFDEFDFEMAETLISHMNQVVEKIRVQEEVESKEKKYRTIFESANDGIFVIDDNYRFIEINQKVLETLKVEREDIIGKTPWDFSPDKQPDGRSSEEKAKEMIDRAREGEPQFFEWFHETQDGDEIITEVSLNRYRLDSEGKVMAVVRNVTEKKETKKELQENKEKIKKLHDTAMELGLCEEEEEVYDITIKAANEVLDFHDCTLAIFDDETEKLIAKRTLRSEYEEGSELSLDIGYTGKTFREKSSFLIEDVSSDDVAKPASEEYRSAISLPIGDIGVFQAMSDEKDYFDKEDLEMTETLVSHTNQVLERIKSQRELRKRERRFRNIFDHALVGIYRTTPDGEVLTANPRLAEMMGLESVEEMISKNISDISEPTDYSREDFKEMMEKEGEVEGFEGSHLLQDGSIIHIIENAVAVKDEEGNIKYYDGTMQDITDLKETQKKLEESEKRYRAIFENTGTATIIIDPDRTIALANKKFERLTGHFRGGVEGKDFLEFVVEEDKERTKRYHEQRREDPERAPNEYDVQGVTKQEDIKELHVRVNMIPGTEKTVVSITDITDKKEIIKERDHYQSSIEETRDMMEIMESYLERLERTELDEEQEEELDKLKKTLKKIDELVED